MKKKICILLLSIIVAVTICSIGLRKICSFLIDIQWFNEVGYLNIYLTNLIHIFQIVIPVFFIISFSFFLYYKILIRYMFKGSIVKPKKRFKKFFLVVNFSLSISISIIFTRKYFYSVFQFIKGEKFNVKDPIFNKDIGFFVFKLPLIQSMQKLFMFFLFFLISITIIIYMITVLKEKILKNDNSESKKSIRKFSQVQLVIVLVFLMIFLALRFLIKSWNLAYSPEGLVFGASYVDVKLYIPLYRILAMICFSFSFIVPLCIIKKKSKPIILFMGIVLILSIFDRNIGKLAEAIIRESNGISIEKPYVKNNIQFTKKAFNLDKIEEKPFNISNDLTSKDLEDNKNTLNNMRINSSKPALEFFNEFQYIKSYYKFKDIDVDRYNINGQYSQVLISPREISKDFIKAQGDDWESKHLMYTHGYGVVVNGVSAINDNGQPSLIMKDIPVQNNTELNLDNPRIYFGENTSHYVIVNTKLGELDYPLGEKNQYNKYDGSAGIKTNVINRILFCLKERNYKFILSDYLTSKSKILLYRDVLERVKKIVPFLTYDEDPYLIIHDGRLKWIIDGYTTSNRYPFSESYEGINYIRNSVKVIVDAYDGKVEFYICDKNDSIIKTYSNMFPKLFKKQEEAPSDIRAHFRYPEKLFNIQCNVLKKYHENEPMIFIKSEDIWDVTTLSKDYVKTNGVTKPPYTILKLPEESKEEMVLLQYFNTKNRDNMCAIFGARMDAENYGKLVLLKIPIKYNAYSPALFEKKIYQDLDISKEVSLLNTKETTEIIYGETLIIPIKNSLIYIKPMYLRAKGEKSIPEIKKIIIGCNDKIYFEDNLYKALERLVKIKSL